MFSVIARLVLAVVVGVVVFAFMQLFGSLIATLDVNFARVIGHWLVQFAPVFGLLAAAWYFFSGASLPSPPAKQ